MATCPSCGEENPAQAKFCLECGAPLPEVEAAETRKTVTALFCDVTGSTAMGEKLDAESLRRVMSDYFDAMQAVLERHGATVEKFIGDAIMAVFGIPTLHEDDALRAVRAASEMRAVLTRLNDELDAEYGVRIAIRIGVNTGQVVSADPSAGQKLVTGDAVNVAARLEQAAQPGECLIGAETHRLVREAVRAEPVEPLDLKGKSERVPAWRILDVLPEAPAFTQSIDAPFVGRSLEMSELRMAFAAAVDDRICRLVTIVGPPGIGKSRLVRELAGSVADTARVVVGRCLPYGEGITYWPLAEIVRQVADGDALGRVAELVAEEADAALIADRVAAAIGAAGSAGPPEETAWAFRKLFEALGRKRPLLAIVDDIHWAEPTLLDLLEYLVSFSADVPILLLCLARADLFDSRPSWAAPRPNASLVDLKPLSNEESEGLVAQLLRARHVPGPTRERIVEAAEGNPLFVEQMLAMQAEEGAQNGELVLPPTIQALLAARIDRLEHEERVVIERASVEGRVFHRNAVAELLPAGAQKSLGAQLMTLIRKEFIRPDRAVFRGDDSFRFGHILIRDAAYESMAKELRADLHARFADWLERTAGDRLTEFQEILGYHLEQACRYRAELRPHDERSRALATRAANHLAVAGRRAHARGDLPAAAGLLGRATALLPKEDRRRLELLPALAEALTQTGDFAGAEALLAETLEAASAGREPRLEAHALVASALLRDRTATEGWADEARQFAERAIAISEQTGDELGLARAWRLLAEVYWHWSRAVAAEDACERAVEHAQRAGDRREEAESLSLLARMTWPGPTPAPQAIGRCDDIISKAKGDRKVEAFALAARAVLQAMAGSFAEARASSARSRAILEELGLTVALGNATIRFGAAELLAGDLRSAERELRSGYELLQSIGEKGYLSSLAADLAAVVYEQRRYAEARQLSEIAERAASEDDVASQVMWRSVRAKTLARSGDLVQAESLARAAVTLADDTDLLPAQADALRDLAEVLSLAGRLDEAVAVFEEARRLYEQKGNVVAAGRTRALLDDLRGSPAPGQ
jgi:class 3 adenylate cyclase/tetratricopeptide (TPR) repeat protein